MNRKEVLALGDSGNDEPMFEKGFQSLCPSNAREDIKKLENVIELNETNNEPFIRAAIDNFQTKTTPKYQEWLDKELSTVDRWLAKAKKISQKILIELKKQNQQGNVFY
ncbi:MAG: HAD hydrolase family protein [Clostridia bacterium]|nr:HAD hydrolase family protein [Clostridia bacterium]